MNDHTNDPEAKTGEGFPARWSRRKTAERDRAKHGTLQQASVEFESNPSQVTNTEPNPDAEPAVLPEDLPEIESLGKDSDYTPFLQKGVPDELRRMALRKLWLSDPAFGFLDGLNDYDENFSAIGIVAQEISTSYIPGRGFADLEEPKDEIHKIGEESGPLKNSESAESQKPSEIASAVEEKGEEKDIEDEEGVESSDPENIERDSDAEKQEIEDPLPGDKLRN